jgi:cyclic-di-GMP-binding protein
VDLNHRRLCRQIYSLLPLATRAPTQGATRYRSGLSARTPIRAGRAATLDRMPSFDVVSEVDRQEVRNAVDQAQRELSTRFDFKNTNSTIEQNDLALTLRSSSEDRLRALRQVLEERLVKRGVSLKGLDYGKVEEAASSTVRQAATITVGISSDKAREINRMIKDKGPKGVSSQTQGDQVRVTGKKRDDLQSVISLLKGADLSIPLQFTNFRD